MPAPPITLSKLIRQIPTRRQLKRLFDQLKDEKDISIAIVGSALVESALDRLIQAYLPNRNKELMVQLFRGPLSNFYSKILIAQALNLINSSLAGNLQSIRSIRNAFARSPVIRPRLGLSRAEFDEYFRGN